MARHARMLVGWVAFAISMMASPGAHAAGATLELRMASAKGPGGSGVIQTYTAGRSPNPIPSDMISKARQGNRPLPLAALKPGDTIVFVNTGSLVYKPFSYSLGNRFEFGKAGIRPGESRTYVVKNTSSKPVFLAIRDEIHDGVNVLLVVLGNPGGAEPSEGDFAGEWNSTVGKLTMTKAGSHVTGKFSGPPAGTLEGDVDSEGLLRFKWTQGATRGIGKFELDGDKFKGTWNYILSDGKSIGRGGQWKGTRIKP